MSAQKFLGSEAFSSLALQHQDLERRLPAAYD
jgi:hypothetical protein